MGIKEKIMDILDKKRRVRALDIIKATGFSRAYVNRFFQELRDEGRIVLIGKANKAYYIPASESSITLAKSKILDARHILRNTNLFEDKVMLDIKKNTGIFLNISRNVSDVLNYAFLEMLNNAIEHSGSKMIEAKMKREKEGIHFDIVDRGVGIFNNIIKKRKLHSEIEAIQDLLKGKQTTMPRAHSGEGIFFTSKVARMLVIQSSHKKLIFNNIVNDVFIREVKFTRGTRISFYVNLDSKIRLAEVFKQYSDESFKFSKTRVTVKLYKMDSEYISRSQGRRILSGLDKFKTITLDFKGIRMIGQGFADEVFRVWKRQYPHVDIMIRNADENIRFMINRAL